MRRTRVEDFKARYDGSELHMWLEIRVSPDLTLRDAHDIGEGVERRLLQEADVCGATVHVDADG